MTLVPRRPFAGDVPQHEGLRFALWSQAPNPKPRGPRNAPPPPPEGQTTRAAPGVEPRVFTIGGCPGAAPDTDNPSIFWPPEGRRGGRGWEGGCSRAGVPAASSRTHVPHHDPLVALIILNTQFHPWGGGGIRPQQQQVWGAGWGRSGANFPCFAHVFGFPMIF